MKKQKQGTISPSEFDEMVNQHKMKEVSPPQEANKSLESGSYPVNKAKAIQTWFRTAKLSSGHVEGFLGVPQSSIDKDHGIGREMLHKANKKKK